MRFSGLLGFIFFMAFISSRSLAQGIIITGKVINQKNAEGEKGATIIVKTKKDSAIVVTTISNNTGDFELSVPSALKDSVILSVSLLGFESYASDGWVPQKPLDFKSISLIEKHINLKEVEIVSKKPFIEQKNDRITVNVGSSPVGNSGTVFDMLQKLPGITVDPVGNILLHGKQGVKVYINGRPSYLSSGDLANLLKSLPSSNVNTVDIIANPSAKFDASGNAGIVIINTKKNTKDLYSVTLSTTNGFGKYFQSNSGLNWTVNQRDFYLAGSYFYTDNNTFRYSDLYRRVINPQGIFDFKQFSNGKLENSGSSYNLNGGIDLNKHNKLGFSIDGLVNNNKVSELNSTYINTPPSLLDSTLLINNHELNKTNSFSAGAFYELKTDTTNGKLHAEINYSDYDYNGLQTFQTQYYDKNSVQYKAPDMVRNVAPANIRIFSSQIDLNGKMPWNVLYEVGGKYSTVKTDNNYKFETAANDDFIIDPNKSDHFLYKETISAGYVNLSKRIKKYTIQAGLRLENTQSDANSLTNNLMVDRSYTNLFPSFFLQRELTANSQINLNYSRRIDRPDYQDLNPFVVFNDKYTYSVGNPYLKPQFTNNFQLSYTYKEITIASSYSYTTDAISQITQQIDSSKITYTTSANINKLTNYSLSISYPLTITSWWDFYTYIEGYHNRYQSILSGQALDNQKFTVTVFTEQDLKLAKDLNFSLSFNYRSSAYNGIYLFKPTYFFNTGLTEKLLSKKLLLRLSLDDIFNTQKSKVTTNFSNMNYNLVSGRDSRRILLGISYTIGSEKRRPDDSNTLNKDERKRIKKE